MKKILVVFGTRPEALKLIPVINELKKHSTEVRSIICSTGQHREMLDQVLKLFSVTPHYDLNVMKPEQSLEDLSARLLKKLGTIMIKKKPDIVVVQGDTTTAMIAALTAFYHKIPVAHVEAGLRSGDKYQPFPEEINRKFISNITDLHFVHSQKAKDNLLKEYIRTRHIYITGNTIVDTLKSIKNNVEKNIPETKKRIILLTVHRRENLGRPLQDIFLAIKQLVKIHPDIEIHYPLHHNPEIREMAYKYLGNNKRIHLVKPQMYTEFVEYMLQSYLILTDSGGIQEEAPYFHKPVLVLRNTTERPEGIEAGVSKLIGTETEIIVNEVTKLLTDQDAYQKMSQQANPYGDGHAAERIVELLLRYLA